MKVINTFMHDGRVLRPGDAVPSNVSDGELLAWKNNGLIGENYDGPTRRTLPAPVETKPASPSRKQPAAPKQPKPAALPKPAETNAASDAGAATQQDATASGTNDSENQSAQGQAATDGVSNAVQEPLQTSQDKPE